MKKLFILLLFIGMTSAVSAKFKIRVGEMDVTHIVKKLPATEEYADGAGRHVDLSVLYTVYSVSSLLPLYVTKEPELVLETEGGEGYYAIPAEKVDSICKAHQVDKEAVLTVPFYDRWGGKIVLALLVALVVWGFFFSSGDDRSKAKRV